MFIRDLRKCDEFAAGDGSVLPTHRKATPVRAWMNGFRCGVSLQSETPNPKKPRL